MQASIRQKTIDEKLVLTAWSSTIYDKDAPHAPQTSYISLGMYQPGEWHCEKPVAELDADKNGKLSLTVHRDVLAKFGITINITDK